MNAARIQDFLAAPLAALALAGRAHLGPKTVAVDRFDYSLAIAKDV